MKAICLPRRSWSFFLGFLLLEADLELGILEDLVQSRSNPRVQHLEIPKIFPVF